MTQIEQTSINTVSKTIQKTILSSVLQDGFWSRWIAHGLKREVINEKRSYLVNLDGWINVFQEEAQTLTLQATEFIENEEYSRAEEYYRLAGLYFNIIQWLFPEPNEEKLNWYKWCLEAFKHADRLSKDQITKHSLSVGNTEFIGRVRKPQNDPVGVIIIINPIDSNKEELYTYESDFAEAGFVVVNFDGPGQGETLLINKHKANKENWSSFLQSLIDFSNEIFFGLPIHLFGTSSGGAWAIEGGKHPLVSKIISVSPAPKHDVKMPDFFRERMSNVLEEFENGFLPVLKDLNKVNNILLFHGKEDVMVEEGDILFLYEQLSSKKRLITYEDEGHCCNFKLPELRQRSIEWLKGESIDEI